MVPNLVVYASNAVLYSSLYFLALELSQHSNTLFYDNASSK